MSPKRLIIMVLALLAFTWVNAQARWPTYSLVRSKNATDKLARFNKHLQLLFAQTATHGAIQPVKNSPGTYLLILKGVHKMTLYFSDRPQRITGSMPTENFVKHWTRGKNSFAKNPPNAVLEVLKNGNRHHPFDEVVTLYKPIYKKTSNRLQYTVKLLENKKPITKIVQFKAASLFIDNWSGDLE